jgi:DNA-damage-inducible protein D
MKHELVSELHNQFEKLVHTDLDNGVEFWLARDLQAVLGYRRWENFSKVVEKAITSCETAGYDPGDHFREVTKMVPLGSGAEREVEDVALTRYACYLIAQNGDPSNV